MRNPLAKATILLFLFPALPSCVSFGPETAILTAHSTTFQEQLAAHEVRRYLYLRTGQLAPIIRSTSEASSYPQIVLLARKGSLLFEGLETLDVRDQVQNLENQQYLITRLERESQTWLAIAGGDPVGTLYGAYRFAELLGVRFYLHGDVIPDERIPTYLPAINETGKPLFELRGILPFHDFPEGPDWWNSDDYAAVLGQLPKLRMNFFGLHTYPENRPNAEPTVWIGLEEDIGKGGSVKHSYPSSYQNTERGNWGYAPKKTSDFNFGASMLFEKDNFGADVMSGLTPFPATTNGQNELFQRVGNLLKHAFNLAKLLGVRTCVGTETPLILPTELKQRLINLGKDPDDPAVTRQVYAAIFERISKTYPLDYYWFWTPEDWTWQKVNQGEVQAVERDLQLAVEASREAKTPFALATCGWVLGPPPDRTRFDRILPKELAFSCINRQLGKDRIDKSFASIEGRPKWAIPWMEDDPRLISPQLWVGRMRKDAMDALRYGCNGLMGIHWRTRVIAPNIAALAQAAWEQSGWDWEASQPPDSGESIKVFGGRAVLHERPISGSRAGTIYESSRIGPWSYVLDLPNGIYSVKLRFAEREFDETGRRVFHVRIQGNVVAHRLDIYARAGKNRALDLKFESVLVNNGSLSIDTIPIVGEPLISALSIQKGSFKLNINSAGPNVEGYAADPKTLPPVPRSLQSIDLYFDWAFHSFGASIAKQVSEILSAVDGQLHEPSQWVEGPGAIAINRIPWNEQARRYAFVEDLENLSNQIDGVGNRARFRYWLDTFRFMRASARVGCRLGELERVMSQLRAKRGVEARNVFARSTILPIRRQLLEEWAEMTGYLLAAASSLGELGTIANLEQHSMAKLALLNRYDDEISKALGSELPGDTQPWKDYRGPNRIIVPTRRGMLFSDESFQPRVIVLSQTSPEQLKIYWRPLGTGPFNESNLVHLARGVYRSEDVAPQEDFEYFVEASVKGEVIRFPETAPELNQTVLILPAPSQLRE